MARVYLDQGRADKAAEQLEAVREDDPEYRADEVFSLLIEAGVEEPPAEESSDEADAIPDEG